MKRVLIVLGTRPEAIKLAPIILALKQDPNIQTIVCHSGQQSSLVESVLKLFQIKADLQLTRSSQTSELTPYLSELLIKFNQIFQKQAFDLCVVHGDTLTALAAAQAAFLNQTPVAHVEAGLRTSDLAQPFPEEANRQLISRLAHLHFSPTPLATQNLIKENVAPEIIMEVGNTAVDALEWVKENRFKPTVFSQQFDSEFQKMIQGFSGGTQTIGLLTLHRREHWQKKKLVRWLFIIREVVHQFPNIGVICPVHPNPDVLSIFQECLAGDAQFNLVDPLSYDLFLYCLYKADWIITDSGGVQEEAPSFGTPVYVLRESTERPEAVLKGQNCILPLDEKALPFALEKLLSEVKPKAVSANPFGDGQSALKICSAIQQFLNRK